MPQLIHAHEELLESQGPDFQRMPSQLTAVGLNHSRKLLQATAALMLGHTWEWAVPF